MASKAQRRYIHANHPELAKEFESKTPKGKRLPERTKAIKRIAKRKKRGTSKV